MIINQKRNFYKKKTTFLILMSFVFILFLNFSSAQYYQQNTKFNFQIPVSYLTNSTIPTNVSLSIFYPNGSSFLINKEMIKSSDSSFSYTIQNISELGVYSWTTTNKISTQKSYSQGTFTITPIQNPYTPIQVVFFMLSIFLCIGLAFVSYKLIKNTPKNSILDFKSLYKTRKKNEATFYLNLIKSKLWILGVFGVYLSIFVAVAIFDQAVFGIGLTGLYSISSNLFIVLAWGLVPFVIFWIVYMILFFVSSVKNTLAWQYGDLKQ